MVGFVLRDVCVSLFDFFIESVDLIFLNNMTCRIDSRLNAVVKLYRPQ